VGHQVTRDLKWQFLIETSERLAAKYGEPVKAVERREGFWITAAFESPMFGVFERVYRRRLWNRNWEDLQPIQEAAAKVGRVLRERT
jgi:hypothetical protein